MLFITIQPWLQDHIGHFYAYNKAVRQACIQNNWLHFSLVPKDCKIKNLPSDWLKKLTSDSMCENKTLGKKLLTQWKNIFPYFLFFRKLKKRKEQIYLMIEQFGLPELFILSLALFLFRPKVNLILLHRFSLKDLGKKAKCYLFLHKFLTKIYKKENLLLFSDSDLVAKSLSSFFNYEFNVLPIPHTAERDSLRNIRKDEFLWWPGGSTRPDKGLFYIKRISNLLAFQKSNYKLVVANSAKKKISNRKNVVFVESDLSPKEYNLYMQEMGLILLPYLPEEYHSRTSGIFVEAVTMGAIPVVIDGTWMAYELKKHDLNELILDFSKDDILKRFEQIQASNEIMQKLQKMKASYLNYHSINHYAKEMKNFFNMIFM